MDVAPRRKSWTGSIRLGGVSQDINAFSKAKHNSIRFRTAHGACEASLNRQTVCRNGDTNVQKADVLRVYEHVAGQCVVVSDDDHDACKVLDHYVVELKGYVYHSEFLSRMVVDSFYLEPTDPAQSDMFVALREALGPHAGVGTLVTKTAEKLVVVKSRGDGLVLHILRRDDEVWAQKVLDLPAPADDTYARRLHLALLAMQTDTIVSAEYPDRYSDNVKELVCRRVEGGHVRGLIRMHADPDANPDSDSDTDCLC